MRAETIVLPAGPEEELTWKKELEQAESCKVIVWQMDWGKYSSRLTDEEVFASQALTLKAWGDVIGARFLDRTAGVILYQGPVCPPLKNETLDRYHIWREDREDTLLRRRLYSSGLLYEYMHRLGSFLPDTVSLIADLDASAISSPAQQAILFSSERTLHLQLKVRGAKIPVGEQTATLGLCLPSEDNWTEEFVRIFDELLDTIGHDDYRLVPERLLNEQWDGLDEILVIEAALTAKGRRMLQGFIAAGGSVRYE